MLNGGLVMSESSKGQSGAAGSLGIRIIKSGGEGNETYD